MVVSKNLGELEDMSSFASFEEPLNDADEAMTSNCALHRNVNSHPLQPTHARHAPRCWLMRVSKGKMREGDLNL
jgi:hypothetical protein